MDHKTRRWRASGQAGLNQIEAIGHDKELSEAEVFELQLTENCIRQELSPIENAKALQTLQSKKNCSCRQLAEELRLNVSTITRTLALLKLPEDIQQQLDKSRVPPGVARELVKLNDPEKQRKMVPQYLDGGLSSAQAATAVRESKGQKKPANPSGTQKSFSLPDGLKIVVTSRKRQTNAKIAEALREFAAMLENDGRTRRSMQAA